MKKLKQIFIVVLLIMMGACTSMETEENKPVKDEDYLEYNTNDFTFKLKKGLKWIKTSEKSWIIYDIKNITPILPEKKLQNSTIIIEKKEFNSPKEFENEITDQENNSKVQGMSIVKKNIEKEGIYGYKIEFEKSEYGHKGFVIAILIDKTGYFIQSTSLSFNPKQYKQNKSIMNNILESMEVKKQPYFFKFKTQSNILTWREALEDLDKMRDILNINPSLYLYRNKEKTNDEFIKLKEKIKTKEEWNKNELYFLFQNFISGAKDGHTYIIAHDSFDIDHQKKFPLPIVLRNGKVYIGDNKLYPEIISGKIKSINGIDISEIINKLGKLISYDFGCEEWKSKKLQEEFSELYQIISGKFEKYKLVYSKDGVEKTLILDKKNTKKNKVEKMFEISYMDKSTSILRINRFWDIDKNNAELRKDLKISFNKIEEKNIKNLIVDIRGNGGGANDYADMFYDFIKGWEKKKDQNEVYLLIDRGVFSAAVYFSALFKISKNAKIIGESTGGPLKMSGNSIEYKLKNSGLKIKVARAYFNFSQIIFGNNDYIGTVKPDIPVEIDPIREVFGKDQIMAKTLEIINKKNRSSEINRYE